MPDSNMLYAYIWACRLTHETLPTSLEDVEIRTISIDCLLPVTAAIPNTPKIAPDEKFYTNFWRLEGLYELYILYKDYTRNLREFLHFLNELRDRRITTRVGFKKVLKMIDYDKAMKESADFKLNTSSEIWNNDTPNNEDSSTDVLV